MKTGRNGAALLLGGAVFAAVAGSAFANGDRPILRTNQGGIAISTRPILKVKPQNDLAAMDLVTTFEGDPTQGTAKMIMVGTCKNLGSKAYQPGVRGVNIERKQGNSWITVQGKTLPALAPGKVFTVSIEVQANDTNTYRLEVTKGGPNDQNPDNDIFVPSAAPVEPPR